MLFCSSKPLHWILPGNELYPQFYYDNAILIIIMFLASCKSHWINNSAGVLYKYVRSCSWYKNFRSNFQNYSSKNRFKAHQITNRFICICSLMACVFIYYNFAFLCNHLFIQLLTIVWDLILIEGSTALLKTALIFLEYIGKIV